MDKTLKSTRSKNLAGGSCRQVTEDWPGAACRPHGVHLNQGRVPANIRQAVLAETFFQELLRRSASALSPSFAMLTHKLHTTKTRIEMEDVRLNTDTTTLSRTPAGRKHANKLKAKANRELALAKADARKLENHSEESYCFTFFAGLVGGTEAKDVQKE